MKKKILIFTLYIARFLMSFIYFFIKLFPMQKNKIVMISRQSNKISIDFEMILDELKENYPDKKAKVLCKKIPNDFIGKITYCFYIIKCMYHISTARACIVDGYVIPISALKHKKKLVIIQIWHAMGAIKKFGVQALDKQEGSNREVAKIMRMHKNYTFVTCTSNATKEFYAEGFNTEKEKILTLGMPRVDYLLNRGNKIEQAKENILNTYQTLKEKKTIVYVPTFRKNESTHIYDLIKNVDKEKYDLIIRLHPLDTTELDEEYKIAKEYKTEDILKIADYVITDYSAIAFEACVLDKPMFFYLYDINEYEKNRGLNVNIRDEMPSATSTNVTQIIEKIDNNEYDYNELERFKNKYIETLDIRNTERIINQVIKLMEE